MYAFKTHFPGIRFLTLTWICLLSWYAVSSFPIFDFLLQISFRRIFIIVHAKNSKPGGHCCRHYFICHYLQLQYEAEIQHLLKPKGLICDSNLYHTDKIHCVCPFTFTYDFKSVKLLRHRYTPNSIKTHTYRHLSLSKDLWDNNSRRLMLHCGN